MPYQYVCEPLTAEDADQLANACETHTEQLIVWTLLDTGIRVSELCALTTKDVLWQQQSHHVPCPGNADRRGSHHMRTNPRSPETI
jgi:integrase/recombinase XerD